MAKNNTFKVIAKNIFRHPNFWNLQNFKNRIHVLHLMFLPQMFINMRKNAVCNRANCDEIAKAYKTVINATENFWSACGDSMDYKFYILAHEKYKSVVDNKYDESMKSKIKK